MSAYDSMSVGAVVGSAVSGAVFGSGSAVAVVGVAVGSGASVGGDDGGESGLYSGSTSRGSGSVSVAHRSSSCTASRADMGVGASVGHVGGEADVGSSCSTSDRDHSRREHTGLLRRVSTSLSDLGPTLPCPDGTGGSKDLP